MKTFATGLVLAAGSANAVKFGFGGAGQPGFQFFAFPTFPGQEGGVQESPLESLKALALQADAPEMEDFKPDEVEQEDFKPDRVEIGDFKPGKVEQEDFKPDEVEVEDHKPVLVMEKFEGQDAMKVVAKG